MFTINLNIYRMADSTWSCSNFSDVVKDVCCFGDLPGNDDRAVGPGLRPRRTMFACLLPRPGLSLSFSSVRLVPFPKAPATPADNPFLLFISVKLFFSPKATECLLNFASCLLVWSPGLSCPLSSALAPAFSLLSRDCTPPPPPEAATAWLPT